uniref:Uncharacterized protein n=1 Tax=Mycena chlorophos TaxID=658473 RepID=A0ABQ0LWM6_MYCCL|nr:predicted protein [Mycena chlorophos]
MSDRDAEDMAPSQTPAPDDNVDSDTAVGARKPRRKRLVSDVDTLADEAQDSSTSSSPPASKRRKPNAPIHGAGPHPTWTVIKHRGRAEGRRHSRSRSPTPVLDFSPGATPMVPALAAGAGSATNAQSEDSEQIELRGNSHRAVVLPGNSDKTPLQSIGSSTAESSDLLIGEKTETTAWATRLEDFIASAKKSLSQKRLSVIGPAGGAARRSRSPTPLEAWDLEPAPSAAADPGTSSGLSMTGDPQPASARPRRRHRLPVGSAHGSAAESSHSYIR